MLQVQRHKIKREFFTGHKCHTRVLVRIKQKFHQQYFYVDVNKLKFYSHTKNTKV